MTGVAWTGHPRQVVLVEEGQPGHVLVTGGVPHQEYLGGH